MTKTMKIDGIAGSAQDLTSTQAIAAQAKKLEALGYDGLTLAELAHDPFLPLAIAAHETDKIEMRTSIAVAFARSPMNVAVMANDLNVYSKGRFALGLGSQIRPHITRRFSMPWHSPAKQMKEFIEAIHAIWASWFDGEKLDYQGEFYKFSLMTPEFSHKTEYGKPKILLAAVGPLMTKTVAQVADGLIVHPFCTETYLKETILPTVEAELKQRGRTLDDFEIQYPSFLACGETEEALEQAKERVKYRIGFYSSTPAYKPVLDAHEWGDFQQHTNRMTKEGKWDQLAGEVTDEMLETFAAVGSPVDAVNITKKRFAGFVDRVTLDATISESVLTQQMDILRA